MNKKRVNQKLELVPSTVTDDVNHDDLILSQELFRTPDYLTPQNQFPLKAFHSNIHMEEEDAPCPKSPKKPTTSKTKRCRVVKSLVPACTSSKGLSRYHDDVYEFEVSSSETNLHKRMRTRSSISKYLLYLSVEKYKSTFNFEKAVCNHGFFMMAPNKWIPSTKSLQRPLRLMDQCCSVMVTISHPPGEDNLHVCVHDVEVLSLNDQQVILEQVSRMLRISDEDEKTVIEFQKLYPRAKEEGFGRIFRSPSIFEDAVKSLLLCFTTWQRTLTMAKYLCELQLKLSRPNRKKHQFGKDGVGNFPISKEILEIGETNLRKHCGLGMRASYIIKLAQKVEKNCILEKLEKERSISVYASLKKFKGFGPFSIATTLMCMGSYEKVPADSETKRHLQEVYGMSSSKSQPLDKIVEEIYGKYTPFQCIAYWFELVQNYEKSYGRLSELDESKYDTVTAVHSNKRKMPPNGDISCDSA